MVSMEAVAPASANRQRRFITWRCPASPCCDSGWAVDVSELAGGGVTSALADGCEHPAPDHDVVRSPLWSRGKLNNTPLPQFLGQMSPAVASMSSYDRSSNASSGPTTMRVVLTMSSTERCVSASALGSCGVRFAARNRRRGGTRLPRRRGASRVRCPLAHRRW